MGTAAEDAILEPEGKSFWRRHGLLIKMIVLLLIAVLIVLIALFVNLVINKDEHVCKPGICVKTSADILKYIDQSVNPCDDFYAFTCGNFVKNSKEVAPPKATEILNSMIAENGRWSDPPEFTTLQTFYKSCVNSERIEKDKELALRQLLQKLGKWPILQGPSWNASDYYWVDFMQQARHSGANFEWFLEFRVHEDNETSQNYLRIDIPRYLKPLKEDVMTARYNLLKDIASYLGADEISKLEANATMFWLESGLIQIADAHRKERRPDESARLITISEVQALCPNINWLHFVNNVTGLKMHGSDSVVFEIEDYVMDLNRFLQGIPKRLQVDYLLWKIIEDLWPFLGKKIRNRFELYYSAIGSGDSLEFNRQKFCVEETKRQFPFVAESVFIYRNVNSDKKVAVKELVENIRKQMIEFLEDVAWSDKESQKKAINTIFRVNVSAGGPPELFERIKFYQDIGLSRFKFKSDNVLEMIEERNLARFGQRFSRIGYGIDSDKLKLYEKTVNIANFSVVNRDTIVIPAALLQDTIYNTRLPNYMNYATLGKAIAREMYEMVFTNSTRFVHNTTKCLLDRMSDSRLFYKIIKVTFPGDLNLSEFVARELAHDAYAEWSKHHPEELGMPGLKFTRHQLYWIQASRDFCSKNLDDPISRLRMLNPLRNSFNFAKEFSCPVGSRMNPKEKCQVSE